MATKTRYRCGECGYVAPSYLGRCPECQAWNCFTEETSSKPPKTDTLRTRRLMAQPLETFAAAPNASRMPNVSSAWGKPEAAMAEQLAQGAIPLNAVPMESAALYSSGFAELDRVLGGGILAGGYVLV